MPSPAARGAMPATVVGIAYALVSLLIFGIMDALIKWTSASYPTVQVVFFLSLFAFIPVGLFLVRNGGLATLRTRRPFDHARRSLIGLSSMFLFFWAFKLLPLADVIAIGFAGPIFLTALSVPMLGEKVGVRRWSAAIVGFVGIMVMVRPGSGIVTALALIPLAGALGYAFAMVFVRKLSRTESIAAIVFYFTVTSTTASGLALPFFWVTPTALDFFLLASIGLCGGIAQLLMTRSFQIAPVAVIAPFEYSAMVWGIGFGWLIWREVPDQAILIGAAIVIASGLYILHREAVIGRRARADG